jgi:hypothetical protein
VVTEFALSPDPVSVGPFSSFLRTENGRTWFVVLIWVSLRWLTLGWDRAANGASVAKMYGFKVFLQTDRAQSMSAACTVGIDIESVRSV